MTPREWGLAAAAIALALDQGSKLLLLNVFHFIGMQPGEAIPVLPFFNLVMVWNPGVSYGLFPAHGPLGTAILAIFSLAAVGALGWWLWGSQRRILAVGLGLVIGGALGNLIDRLHASQVTDFIQVYYREWYYPTFNVADCGICVGAVLLILFGLRPSTHKAH
jgi:signal peptidase II